MQREGLRGKILPVREEWKDNFILLLKQYFFSFKMC